MMGIRLFKATVFALIVGSLTISTVSAAGLAKGTLGFPPHLHGTRLIIKNGEVSFPANTPFYVHHGWGWGSWAELTPQERQTVLDRESYVYELYIDGVQVPMRLSYHPTIIEVTHDMAKGLWYCAQFQMDTFNAGETHTFVGKYYEFGVLTFVRTLIVHFT